MQIFTVCEYICIESIEFWWPTVKLSNQVTYNYYLVGFNVLVTATFLQCKDLLYIGTLVWYNFWTTLECLWMDVNNEVYKIWLPIHAFINFVYLTGGNT